MIKGSLFTLGILALLGGLGLGGVMLLGAGMSDNPQASDADASKAFWVAGIGGAVGVVLIGAALVL